MAHKNIQFNHNKLNLEEVNIIRGLLEAGKSARSIAMSYNVSDQTILNIKSGHTWKSYSKSEMDDYKQMCMNKTKRGESCNLSKLCEDDVRDIKRKLHDGNKIECIAREYDVSKSAISQIKGGHNWKHIKARAIKPSFALIEESSFDNVLKTWERSREYLQQPKCRSSPEIK